MHRLYELKEKFIKELEEYADYERYSREDIETAKYLASAADHICNILEAADSEYSSRQSYDGYSRRNSYGYPHVGPSYRVDGSYRGRRNAPRDSMGRYSGNGMVEQLESLMQEAPNERIRQQMQQLISQMEGEPDVR